MGDGVSAKRSQSRRPIKLQRWIVALLRDVQTKASAHSLCLEGRDLVFKTASGHPIHADYLAKHFKMILELAGLQTNQTVRFAPLGGHNRAGSRSVAKSCL